MTETSITVDINDKFEKDIQSESTSLQTSSADKLVPLQIHIDDLHFSVPVRKSKHLFKKNDDAQPQYKEVLKGITATINPGTLLAIVGSSGAGKTTLLNVLAGRAAGKIDGKILVNGHPLNEAKQLLKYSSYIMQDDVLLANQTVREVIEFSANMKLDKEFTEQQKKERIESIIKELNLTECQNTRVGSAGLSRGVSGGERKRTSIGVDIINNPSLLYVDEPTSGLDSHTAEQVVQILRGLTRSGRSVITTIHQPNSDIFAMFDQLMILAGGHVVYYGAADKAVDYFAAQGYPCKQYSNPADFFMKLIHIDPLFPESQKRVDHLVEAYKKSDLFKEHQSEQVTTIELPKKQDSQEYSQGYLSQFRHLAKRNFVESARNPLLVRTLFGQTLFISLIMGLIYLQTGHSQASSQDRLGALFFFCVNQSMLSVVSVVSNFPEFRGVFFREHSNHMYGTVPFYLSKVISDLPWQIFFPFIYGTITYWMIGFQAAADKFFIFLCCIILCANVGSAIGLLLGTVAKTVSVAISLVPVSLIPFMIFSGFFVNTTSVPYYFIWIEYISFMKYSFRALVINEFTGLTFTCTKAEEVPIVGGCRISTGEQVLQSLNFDESTVGKDIATLFGLYMALRILAGIVLVLRARKAAAA